MNNPRALIADIASKFLGLKEVTPNRFAGIDRFWADTNYPDGWKNREPWCSAFVSYCVNEADRQSEAIKLRIPPRFAAVSSWLAWAKRPETGCLVFGPDSKIHKPQRGDLVTYLPHLSHIGIVASFDGVRFLHTIEGNTSPNPRDRGTDRDGDGIYDRIRNLSFCGTFIRIPAVGETL